MFVKPQGHSLRVLVRVPLSTYTDAEYPRRAGDYVDLARVDPSLRDRRDCNPAGNAHNLRAGPAAPRPTHRLGADVAGFRQFLRQLRYGAGSCHRVTTAARDEHVLGAGQARCFTRISHTVGEVLYLAARRLRPPGAARNYHGSVSAAGRRCARLRVAGRCRIGEAGPQLVPRRGPVRGGGLSSHSGRHRPSIVFVLPGHSVPAHPSADPHRHRFHRGPFDHPDRLGLWICARCAVVPAPDRNADRHVDRLYGAGEYSGRATEAALDHHLLLRPGARLRFFFRSAQYPAVRRLACADVAFVLQCRRGNRSIVRAGYCSCRP